MIARRKFALRAAELREDLLGALVPCTFQEVTATSSNQRAPNLSTLGSDIRYQPGIHNDMKYEPGTKPVDLNYSVAGSGQTQGYSVQEHAFSGQEAKPRSSSYSSPNNLNHTGAFDAQPVSKQYISRLREGLGVVTNNVAEYRGLILGLKYAIRLGFKRIKVYGDSQLVCYQVKGTWQAKKENMMELCKEVRKLQENFISFEVHHVRREWNSEADRQANIAITLASGAVSEGRGDGF
ncbi:uncharacterized protein [Triticum aestivum]|uniref:uncharacterized protein isoform X2 n=1 Tax=Triticum aestivum TaxID=4565 RepID=UPI001D01FA6E|nr:uncharacterized protein LOC123119697 isoform X2 [Triticum aestivum]